MASYRASLGSVVSLGTTPPDRYGNAGVQEKGKPPRWQVANEPGRNPLGGALPPPGSSFPFVSESQQCARPACGEDVAAWLTYDYGQQRVWLDDPQAAAGGNRWPICSAHANRLRVPLGWVCIDRRTDASGSRPGLSVLAS